MSQSENQLLAVLIDADNVSSRFAEQILKEINAFGSPALKRVYGDWSNGNLNGWRDTVVNLGMVARQETANTSGKNASDIGLVIDAMDLLHSGRFDGFVLVSSDSDFTALANRIREQGLTVVGIGEDKTPTSLRNACNRFVLIENLIGKPDKSDNKAPESSTKKSPKKAASLVKGAMDMIAQEDEWYHLGQLGKVILANNRDFDPRSYGCSNLSTLLRNSGQFELKKADGGFKVRPKAA
ncbi:NYN domain-containing protein [Ruegeria sp. 2012CJ41-6]|uniref:NYN domain-containing protein n=1 Tax=Ruegeria spongiae TaxID=2942209 RepID=A0ABT0PYR0_9RHOB|nr:NYN domain-containing protein [Ruegeria spongiae]MCL6282761.1 NYN domain-containing protein [Ruegeria spongiae]